MKTDFVFIYPSTKHIKFNCFILKSVGEILKKCMKNCNKLICCESYVFSEIKCMKHIH